jgi:hypothetical protein
MDSSLLLFFSLLHRTLTRLKFERLLPVLSKLPLKAAPAFLAKMVNRSLVYVGARAAYGTKTLLRIVDPLRSYSQSFRPPGLVQSYPQVISSSR